MDQSPSLSRSSTRTLSSSAAAIALLLLGSTITAGETVVHDFESGDHGWIGPNTGVHPTNGNGPSAGLQTIFADFGIALRNSVDPNLVSDYTALSDVTISVDIRVNSIFFFSQEVSRPFLLELRSSALAQGGYPWTSVWFKFDDISLANNGSWTTYSVSIEDPTSTELPAGWQGYGDEDPVTFAPQLPAGVTFADVLANFDTAVFSTLEPGFFFGTTSFNFVVDNITFSTNEVAPWSDVGSALGGSTGEPLLDGDGPLTPGSELHLNLSNAAPNAPAVLIAGLSQLDLPFTGGVLVPNPDFVFGGLTNGSGNLSMDFVWPNLAPGTQTFWQYWIVDGGGPFGAASSNGVEGTSP